MGGWDGRLAPRRDGVVKVLSATIFAAAALLIPGGVQAAAQETSVNGLVPIGPPALSWGAPKAVDPSTGGWFSLDCPGASICFAVDGAGNRLMWTGEHWASAGPASSQPRGAPRVTISCANRQFCVTVDASGGASVYDGKAWGLAMEADPVGLEDVSCPSSSFCAAVDIEGNAVTFNGRSWSAPVPLSREGSLDGVSCPSTHSCFALDDNGDVFSYDGAAWRGPTMLGPDAGTGAISCPTKRFCMVVEPGDDIVTYNGARWGPVHHLTIVSLGGAGNSNPTGPLNGISCASPTFCAWSDTEGNVYLYTGKNWGWIQAIDPRAEITTLSCPATDLCVAGDEDGNVIIGIPSRRPIIRYVVSR